MDYDPIVSFKGVHGFLSNFHPSPLVVELFGEPRKFPTVEHAFQAYKATNSVDVRLIQECHSPSQAKKLGRNLVLREDWEKVIPPSQRPLKEAVMAYLLRLKFSKMPFRELLLNTGDRPLIERNRHGDSYWGAAWDGWCWDGLNRLGVLLMELRMDLAREAAADVESSPNG